ncbi:GAF domain-containing hybrid sensor histidine kinase/response regulator [Methylobacterium dankookense]|uniref:histidine kinase n=1 Tax=Methylobacterium dankookense TaxID=560405 RepID=A0A564FWV9_9HYPH|nr:GAF domain-containing hybrid sensor histidine kinase/response regulator [Methylobacterium dankookense]GJD58306.1 Sensor histidine kinase RcsC [Methylobacterium dankookense]VUF12487.1 Aerobic respiration control sensor protein ArcB [Methylobacterium dankookense]
MAFPVAGNEAARLAALHALSDLGADPAVHLDAICRTAASLFGVPIALVSLVEADHLRFGAACGTDGAPIPREGAFCAYTILADEILVCADTTQDPRFADSRLVTGQAGIRFYAGAPLILGPDLRIGTLCLLDTVPRPFGEAQRRQLRDLAAIVVGQLRLHEANRRQQEEIAAREGSEARYRALADALPQLVWIFSVETGEKAYANQQFDRFYGPIGNTRAERLARNHPEDAERMHRAWRTAMRTGSPYRIEGRLRRHDGVYRWHKLIMIPIRQRGEIVAMLGTALDIDEIITARRKLEETGNLLQLAQKAAGAGTWELDLSSQRIVWSGESAALHGIDAPQGYTLDAEEWLSLVDRRDGEVALAAAADAAERHDYFSIEFRVPGADGSTRWVNGTGRAVYDEDGTPLRVIGLNIDVTARKGAEAALVSAKAAAEAARGEAERASAAKSDFLATMSHEIRTPLNGVLGYADLLVDELEPGTPARLYAERIRGAGAALLTVVNDVLDFSKIEAGQVELAAEPFVLTDLMDQAVAIIRAGADGKGLRLEVRAGPGLPGRVIGDADRLRQVLMNLLNNAVKFTDAGGVTLGLERLAGSDAAGMRLRFSVRDTGIGIPAAKLHKLFERFSQVDGSIQREYGGTGLGLAISRQLVELMGGEIGVESEAGRGSTFWFTLRLPVATAARPAGQAAPPPEPHYHPRRILLVEDTPLNRDLALAVLHSAGHAVDAVESGPEAIEAVRAAPYDLVLMDVQMPGMDGMTATRQIRALDQGKALPIVAMTASVRPQQVIAFRQAGMTDHIGKPFKRAALLAAVERWTARGAAAPAPAEAQAASTILDRPTFEEVSAVVGQERMQHLLATLAKELGERFGTDGTTPERGQLAHDAHAMISASGVLGFRHFADLCREVEIACEEQRSVEPMLGRLRSMRGAVIREIESLCAA